MNPKQLTGNTVVIRTPNDEYLLLAHLEAGSIRVAEGDRVEPGQLLARCGNSGNSPEPHLHLQMTERLEGGTGIQMTFAKVLLSDGATAANYAPIRTNRIARE